MAIMKIYRPSFRFLSIVFQTSIAGTAAFLGSGAIMAMSKSAEEALMRPSIALGLVSVSVGFLTMPYHLIQQRRVKKGLVAINGGPG